MRGLGSSEAYNLFRAEALPLVDRTDCSCFIATDGRIPGRFRGRWHVRRRADRSGRPRRERRDELSRSCRVPSERSVLPRSVGHAEDRRAERVGRDPRQAIGRRRGRRHGVWWTHQDIQANMWVNPADGTTHGYDFISGDTNPMDESSGVYHGTGVAGVIAAIIDNGQDVAGTAQVKVMALRALGLNGQGSSFNTSQAIRWAAQNGAKIINLSLGTNETFGGPTDIQLAIDYAWSRGALVVAAAGNAGTGTLDYPARLSNVVSVAAIDETGLKASFSNYGSGLDLAAPGDRILTLDGNNQVHYLTGTSFAAPFVTGAAAPLLSVDPALTNVELWNILNSTAVQPSGGPAYNTNYGWGVVNAWNAINALRQPFISVNAYPTSVSRSSTFGVTWSILGPVGTPVADTHVVWARPSGRLGNATPTQSGSTHQSYTANGLTLPSGTDTFSFKVVAMVNGMSYESREYTVGASNLPEF